MADSFIGMAVSMEKLPEPINTSQVKKDIFFLVLGVLNLEASARESANDDTLRERKAIVMILQRNSSCNVRENINTTYITLSVVYFSCCSSYWPNPRWRQCMSQTTRFGLG